MFIMRIAFIGNETEITNIILKSKQSEIRQVSKNILTTFVATKK